MAYSLLWVMPCSDSSVLNPKNLIMYVFVYYYYDYYNYDYDDYYFLRLLLF